MENNEFKKVPIKSRMLYYFDDIIKLEVCDIDNILEDEKSHINILIYDISYKTFIGSKSLRIRFNKINGFIGIYDETRYFLSLFGSEKYDAIYDRIRYLLGPKSGITNIPSHYFAKIKVDPNDFFAYRKNIDFA